MSIKTVRTTSEVIKGKRNNRLYNIIEKVRKRDETIIFEKTDEGILKTEDFIEYLEERNAKYVFVKGNDQVIEITFLDEL